MNPPLPQESIFATPGSSYSAIIIHPVMTETQIDHLEKFSQKYLPVAMDSQSDPATRHNADKKLFNETYLKCFVLLNT